MRNRYLEMATLVVDKNDDNLGVEGQHQHTVENPWGLHFHADGTLGGSHLHDPCNPLGLHTHGTSRLRAGGHMHGSEAARDNFSVDGAHDHFSDEDAKNKVSDKKESTPVNTDVDVNPKQSLLASIVFPKTE